MSQSMGMGHGMEQSLNPKMIAFYALLQQPSVELEQAIDSELQENPALDLTAERVCPACGVTMLTAMCRECGYQLSKEDEIAEIQKDKLADLALEAAPTEKPAYSADDEIDDVVARLVSPETLVDHLKWAWRLNCSKEHREIGDTLIGCINDDGYLDTDLETLSEGLCIPVEKLEEVLKEIQLLDPVGVGARTLRECLRLQLVHWDERDRAGDHPKLALTLIDEYWETMARHSYEDIARKMKVSLDIDSGSRRFHSHAPDTLSGTPISPFVAISGLAWRRSRAPRRHDFQSRRQGRRLRSHGQRIAQSGTCASTQFTASLWDAMRRDPAGYSSKDREHVQDLSDARARVHRQSQPAPQNASSSSSKPSLWSRASSWKKARIRSETANATCRSRTLWDLHESTVGRAVTGKHAMIPAGEVIPCEMFFDSSLSIKEVIKDLLAEENPRKPFSDEQISLELSKKGIEIARRTVTKYREALKVPPAAQRRRYD